MTPQRAGEFTIPALTADVNGQQLSTAPLKLTVTKASAPSAAAVNSGSEAAFLKFVFPKNKIYVGEPLVGRLELYLRDDVQNFGNFQLTGSPTDGFSSGKTAELQNQRRRVQVGNRVYTVIPIARAADGGANRHARARTVHRQRGRGAAVAKPGRRSGLPAVFQPRRTETNHAGDGTGERGIAAAAGSKTGPRISPAPSAISP